MRVTAGTAARAAAVAIVAVMSVIVLVLPSTITSAVRLLAGKVLVVPGTGTPKPDEATDYNTHALQYYVIPRGTTCTSICVVEGVPYTAQFWPFPFAGWGGLEGAKWDDSVQNGLVSLSTRYGATSPSDDIVIFGYSQGATVSSIFKRQLATLNGGTIPDNVSFVLIGNPNRPNGGLFERLAILGTLPILDATFGQPTPTDTAPDDETTNTTDIAFQYDGVADFPSAPINLLADLNALAGFWYVHGTYLDPRGRPPVTTPDGALAYGYDAGDIQGMVAACSANSSGANCQQFGDTIYVTIPARSLPIMQPFVDLGVSTGTSAVINPVVALLQPITQTLIETGYDRTSYGTPTPFQIIPRVDPIKFVGDVINDVPEGINAAIATINDPNHTIPDLPPSWGTSSTVTIAAKGTDDVAQSAAVPAVSLPKLPKVDLPKIELSKLGPVKLDDDLKDDTQPTDGATPTKRDFHPARDFATSLRKSLPTAPKGLEKALKRLKDRDARKPGSAAPAGD